MNEYIILYFPRCVKGKGVLKPKTAQLEHCRPMNETQKKRSPGLLTVKRKYMPASLQ